MSVWDIYKNRVDAKGGNKRSAALLREAHLLSIRTKDSLSYQTVTINGEERTVTIIDSDNLDEKKMLSLPGENFRCGDIVEWADNHWLISEKDAHNEVYTRVKLTQCNFLLRWIDEDSVIREQWCIISDGTKYLTGEYEDRNYILARGDSRIQMIIGRNEHTVKFGRNNRFLIDDPLSPNKLSYLLTKPLKTGKTYNGEGVFSFVLQEVPSTDDDNTELGIADYYKFFPKEKTNETAKTADSTEISKGKKVWL